MSRSQNKYFSENDKNEVDAQVDESKVNSDAQKFNRQFDYCMVFKNFKRKENKHLQYCVNVLKSFDIELMAFKGNDKHGLGSEIFILIKVDLKVLRKFTDSIDFQFLFDEDKLQEYCRKGDKDRNIRPIEIAHIPAETKLRPYQYIYGSYKISLPEELYWRSSSIEHPFRESYHLKLTALLIESKPDNGENFKNIQINTMLNRGTMLSFFAMHGPEKKYLEKYWLRQFNWPWNEPIEDVKEYFGEKVALYFLFSNYLISRQFLPGLLGILAQILVFHSWNFSHPILPLYGVFIVLWATAVLKVWRRKQKATQLKWGTYFFETQETDRPEFYGEKILHSPVDGRPTYYFPTYRKRRMAIASTIIIAFLICLVVLTVVAIYALRYFQYISQLYASVINAVFIQVFNMLYTTVAYLLTERENHRTLTTYEEHLTAKVFAFQFVNSYASFFYLAFIAQSLGQCGLHWDGSCMELLAQNLGIIFGVNLLVGNVSLVLQPYVLHKLAMRTRGFTKHEQLKDLTPPEREYLRIPYDSVDSNLQRYSNAAIVFGYTVIFVTTLPMAVALATVCIYARLKGDCWLMMRLFQRPSLQGAQDIGIWQAVLEVVSHVAVASNAGIIVFTMNGLEEYTAPERFWVFIGFMVFCFVGQFIIAAAITDEPKQFTVQKARNEFIRRKVINKEPDDLEESVEDDEKDDEGDPKLGDTLGNTMGADSAAGTELTKTEISILSFLEKDYANIGRLFALTQDAKIAPEKDEKTA